MDATEAVNHQVEETRPFLYSVIAKPTETSAYPRGHFLSESHIAASITHFLLIVAHDFRRCAGGGSRLPEATEGGN